VDTRGWDIVSACTLETVNALLAKRMTNAPASVDYQDGAGLEIKVTFDPWRISGFGTKGTVMLDLPIKVGTLTTANKFSGHAETTLDGVTLAISVKLAFVDQAGGGSKDLQFRFITKESNPKAAPGDLVTVSNPDVTGQLAKVDTGGTAGQTLRRALPHCLEANQSALAYTLASVATTAPTNAPWMAPKDTAYLYAPGPSDKNGNPSPGHLVVLAMVRDLDPKTRKHSYDPSLVATQHQLTMALRQDLFLEKMVMPQLPEGFDGPKLPQGFSQFTMAGDEIHGVFPIQCKEVRHAGTGYTPYLSTFRLKIDGADMMVSADGRFAITGLTNASVTFHVDQKLKLKFDRATQRFAVAKDGDIPPVYDKHIPWYYDLIGVVALPWGLLMAGIVVAVVDGVIEGVTESVAADVSTAGQVSGIGALGTLSVEWPGSDGFTMESGELSGALVLRGSVV
jgi:hypothetical protein